MLHDPWFTLIFMVIPLTAGAINKFLFAKGKTKEEYGVLIHILNWFMSIMILIFTVVSSLRINTDLF